MTDFRDSSSIGQQNPQNNSTVLQKTTTNDQDAQQKQTIYIIYACYGLALMTGFIILIGVIWAYVKRDEMSNILYQDHIRFLIKTFWLVVIFGSIGSLLTITIILSPIGLPILFFVYVWFIFRVVYGFIRFTEKRSVTPTGWFA